MALADRPMLPMACWLFGWHRAVIWAGVFVTLFAACMGLVAVHARTLVGDPVVFVTPVLDASFISLTLVSVSYYLLVVETGESPDLLSVHKRIARARKLRRIFRHRSNRRCFPSRIELLSDIESWSLIGVFGRQGEHIRLQSFVFVVFPVAMAVNFHDSGIDCNYVFFRTNRAWSPVMCLTVATIPLDYLFVRYLERMMHA